MADFLEQGSVARRVTAEPALLLGAGRALLMQLAHPAVAQGVWDHSDFRRSPFRRLQGTLEAMNAVVFGSEELAGRVGEGAHRVHEFIVGPSYRANDPQNLLWVHATLIDSALLSYTTFVGPLTDDEREDFYQDMTRVAGVFGCPREAQPNTYADFYGYVGEMIDSLVVTEVGRRLGRDIVRPRFQRPLAVVLGPAVGLHRLFTLGMTPERLREQFGLDWDERSGVVTSEPNVSSVE